MKVLEDMRGIFTGENDNYLGCFEQMPCNQTVYPVTIEKEPVFDGKLSKDNDNVSIIQIDLESPMVEYVIDSYSYDFQSLFGECGGTLGITMNKNDC